MEENLFKNILLLVEGADLDRAVTLAAVSRAVANHSSLIVLNVVDHMLVNRIKRVSDQSAAEIEIELEEKGWKALYYAEEMAKDNAVRTMILQKSGIVENEVLKEVARLKIDLIVLAYPRKLPGQPKSLAQGRLEKIVENSPCSILVVK